jgi:DNA-binding transcriptional LysR family regulator
MTEPEWNDFKVVLALGRGGSVAGAARILGVDGSTISRRLAAAEEAFGAVLIVRGGRDFSFTAEGKAALAAGEAMEAAVTAATAAVRSSKTELQGIVKISCAPSAVHFLLPFPKLVAERHPGLDVELISARTVIDLAKGDADIAMRAVRPTDLDVIVRYNFEWGSCAYAAPDYLKEHGRPSRFDDLSQHQLIRYDDSFQRASFARWIEPYVSTTTSNMRMDSIDMAHAMIAAARGIGVLFCCNGDPDPRLVRVFPEPIDMMQGWIVYHESSRGSVRIKTVADLLIEYVVERRHVLSGRSAD